MFGYDYNYETISNIGSIFLMFCILTEKNKSKKLNIFSKSCYRVCQCSLQCVIDNGRSSFQYYHKWSRASIKKSPSFLSFQEYLLVLNFLKIQLHNSVSDTHIHYIAGYYVFKGIGIKVGIGYVLVETTWTNWLEPVLDVHVFVSSINFSVKIKHQKSLLLQTFKSFFSVWKSQRVHLKLPNKFLERNHYINIEQLSKWNLC